MDRIEDVAPKVRELLRGTTAAQRANELEEIIRQFYNFTKFDSPGGEGLDGRDGAERRSLGEVLTASVEHNDTMRDHAQPSL